jgi:hypothetical protein
MADAGLKRFELENDVLHVSPQDEIYRYDPAEARRLDNEAPWKKECAQANTAYYGGIFLPTAARTTLSRARSPPSR